MREGGRGIPELMGDRLQPGVEAVAGDGDGQGSDHAGRAHRNGDTGMPQPVRFPVDPW